MTSDTYLPIKHLASYCIDLCFEKKYQRLTCLSLRVQEISLEIQAQDECELLFDSVSFPLLMFLFLSILRDAILNLTAVLTTLD